MTFYDFTVSDASGQRVFSVSGRDSMLVCVEAVESVMRSRDPDWSLPEYEDVLISGGILRDALRPHIAEGPLSEDGFTGLGSIDPGFHYIVSWGDV